MGATSEAEVAYPFGAPELTLVFVGFVLLQLDNEHFRYIAQSKGISMQSFFFNFFSYPNPNPNSYLPRGKQISSNTSPNLTYYCIVYLRFIVWFLRFL